MFIHSAEQLLQGCECNFRDKLEKTGEEVECQLMVSEIGDEFITRVKA